MHSFDINYNTYTKSLYFKVWKFKWRLSFIDVVTRDIVISYIIILRSYKQVIKYKTRYLL